MQQFCMLFKEWNELSILLRLVAALVIGILIGLDRGFKRRSAGVKTNVLVCIGAALVMMTSQYMVNELRAATDIARLGAQVISGVGFLGVGTIIVTNRNHVRGLTTAAGLWVCACEGLAVGIGFIEGAIIGLIIVFFTLKILSYLDQYVQNHAKSFELYLEFEMKKNIAEFVSYMSSKGVTINVDNVSDSAIDTDGASAIIGFDIKNGRKRPELLKEIRSMENIKYIEEL